MAEETDSVTGKKPLRLKDDSSQQKATAEDESTSAPIGPVPAVMKRGGRFGAGEDSGTSAAIIALIATLAFAALVAMQVIEWKGYESSFLRIQLETPPPDIIMDVSDATASAEDPGTAGETAETGVSSEETPVNADSGETAPQPGSDPDEPVEDK